MSIPHKRLQLFAGPEVWNHIDVKRARYKLGLTQAKFAVALGVSTRTVEEWERQKSSRPPGCLPLACAYLHSIKERANVAST